MKPLVVVGAVCLLQLGALAAAHANDGHLVTWTETQGGIELDKPGNMLDVRPIYEGDKAPGEGCWVSKESCSYLAQAKKEWEMESWAFKKERRVSMVLALIVGLVGGALAGVLLQRRLQR